MNYLQISPHYLKAKRIAKLEYYETFLGNHQLKIYYINPKFKSQIDSRFSPSTIILDRYYSSFNVDILEKEFKIMKKFRKSLKVIKYQNIFRVKLRKFFDKKKINVE